MGNPQVKTHAQPYSSSSCCLAVAMALSVFMAVVVVVSLTSDRAGMRFVMAVMCCTSAIRLNCCGVVVVSWLALAAVLVTEMVVVVVLWIVVAVGARIVAVVDMVIDVLVR